MPRNKHNEPLNADRPSKSQRKRESKAMQSLGESLIALRPADLETLDLPDRLFRAVREAQGMHQRGALRRQRLFIGRLLREMDADPIRKALAVREHAAAEGRRLFHLAERWRERIVSSGAAAIDDCSAEFPVDAGLLGELLVRIETGGSRPLRKAAYRDMFRHIHAAIGGQEKDKDC